MSSWVRPGLVQKPQPSALEPPHPRQHRAMSTIVYQVNTPWWRCHHRTIETQDLRSGQLARTRGLAPPKQRTLLLRYQAEFNSCTLSDSTSTPPSLHEIFNVWFSGDILMATGYKGGPSSPKMSTGRNDPRTCEAKSYRPSERRLIAGPDRRAFGSSHHK